MKKLTPKYLCVTYVLILNELSQSLPPENNETVLLQFLKVRDFFKNYIYTLYLFLVRWDPSSQTRNQTCSPLQLKNGFWTTGSPRKSLKTLNLRAAQLGLWPRVSHLLSISHLSMCVGPRTCFRMVYLHGCWPVSGLKPLHKDSWASSWHDSWLLPEQVIQKERARQRPWTL